METNNILKSKLNLNIKGNYCERFIKRLKSNNIEILNITYISNDELNIKIYKKDYEKVIDIKTIYEVNILDYYGAIKIKNNILNNKYVITFILLALISLYIVTNMIFSIEVVTNDSNMSYNLKNDLYELGIKKYNFKRNYNQLQIIKKSILEKYKDKLEWIEIESIGTKYIVRYEPRIINENNTDTELRNIVATKDAVIHSLYISNGQIVKNTNSYVKKGDVIVSGYITMNGVIKNTVSSTGKVYGETWYKVAITYPYKYYEVTETGNAKNVFIIKIFNKEIELFNFNKYKTKKEINKTILENNLLPISLIKQTQKETNVIDENNNEEELIEKAVEYSKNKLKEKFDEDEYINNYKILSRVNNKDSITLNIFYSIVENIGKYQKIEEYAEIEE